MQKGSLKVEGLHVEVEGKEILKGIDLEAKQGEVTVLMGPNGSGKSTLAYAAMGHPKYKITKAKIFLNGEDITAVPVYERAKKGLFLSSQYPSEVSGVTVSNFLRTALGSIRGSNVPVLEFQGLLAKNMDLLRMDHGFANRYLNEGFSGGEKKKAEILQLSILQPKIAILDETDSGTDVDALKVIASGVKSLVGKGSSNMGALVITHYQRFLEHIKPDKVHIVINGRIAKSGGHELVHELESEGYDRLIQEARLEAQKRSGLSIVQ